MLPLTHDLISIRSGIESLSTLAPGHGYDRFGEALTNIAAQPISLSEANAVMAEAEAASPGLLRALQTASIESEMALELYHARQLIEPSDESKNLHEKLFQDYQYDWFTGRAALEASLITTPDNGQLPLVYYFGASGIPFSALTVQKRKPSRAIWFDPHESSRQVATTIIDRLKIDSVQMLDLDHTLIRDTLQASPASYISILDAKLVTPEFLDLLKQCQATNISFVTTHGLNELLYPAAPESLIADFFEFRGGYYPERISGIPAETGWKPSADLSFVSLALYK